MNVSSQTCRHLVLWDTQSRVFLPKPASCLIAPMAGGQRSQPHGQKHPGAGLRVKHLCWERQGTAAYRQLCLEVLLGQLPPAPVSAESQQSSFGVLVTKGCGEWGPAELAFPPHLFRVPTGPTRIPSGNLCPPRLPLAWSRAFL